TPASDLYHPVTLDMAGRGTTDAGAEVASRRFSIASATTTPRAATAANDSCRCASTAFIRVRRAHRVVPPHARRSSPAYTPRPLPTARTRRRPGAGTRPPAERVPPGPARARAGSTAEEAGRPGRLVATALATRPAR